jgi:hypothetical protein
MLEPGYPFHTLKKMSQPVSAINGIGPKTVQKLNARGIFTAKQLLESAHVRIEGVNMEKVMAQAQEAAVVLHTVEIKSHTWARLMVHVAREKGHVIRATVENIVVGEYQVAIRVKWGRDGKHTSLVHPAALLAARILWLSRDIVSDDSDGETIGANAEPIALPKLKVLHEEELTIFSHVELKAVQNILRETNRLVDLL